MLRLINSSPWIRDLYGWAIIPLNFTPTEVKGMKPRHKIYKNIRPIHSNTGIEPNALKFFVTLEDPINNPIM